MKRSQQLGTVTSDGASRLAPSLILCLSSLQVQHACDIQAQVEHQHLWREGGKGRSHHCQDRLG